MGASAGDVAKKMPKTGVCSEVGDGSCSKNIRCKSVFKSTDDAANMVADDLGGTISKLRNGFKIEIPNGSKPIVIRIMNQGSGGRKSPYFRMSIDGKGSLTLDGVLSNDRALTHIDMTDGYLQQIRNAITRYRGK